MSDTPQTDARTSEDGTVKAKFCGELERDRNGWKQQAELSLEDYAKAERRADEAELEVKKLRSMKKCKGDVMSGCNIHSWRSSNPDKECPQCVANKLNSKRYEFLRYFGNLSRVNEMLTSSEFTTLDSAVDAAMKL